jgi:hypothetical protein
MHSDILPAGLDVHIPSPTWAFNQLEGEFDSFTLVENSV